MNNFNKQIVIAAALAILVAAPLSGCGKKGDPKPPSKDGAYPKAYPKGTPRSDAAPNDLQFAFKVNRAQ